MAMMVQNHNMVGPQYSMSPVGATGFHPPVIIQQSSRNATHTSCGLVTIGTFLALTGIGSIGMGVYAITKVGTEYFAIAPCVAGGIVILTGILAIYAGCNVWTRQATITMSCVVACFALIACGVTNYFIAAILFSNNDKELAMVCVKCHGKLWKDNIDLKDPLKIVNAIVGTIEGTCQFLCERTPYLIILGLSELEGLLCFILFCVSCCNTCSCCCCYKPPPPF